MPQVQFSSAFCPMAPDESTPSPPNLRTQKFVDGFATTLHEEPGWHDQVLRATTDDRQALPVRDRRLQRVVLVR